MKVTDRRLARIVRQCQDIPGQELFQYVDEAGERHSIDSADVNDYLREITGEEFTAKDFRTWAGTVLASRYLRQTAPAQTQTESRSQVLRTIEQVAAQLGNTVAVCASATCTRRWWRPTWPVPSPCSKRRGRRLRGLAQDARPPEAVDEAQSPTGHEQAGAQGLSDEETAVLALLRQSAAVLAPDLPSGPWPAEPLPLAGVVPHRAPEPAAARPGPAPR